MQQKAPRLVLQINYTLPAGMLDICSKSSILCQGGHFSGTYILPTHIYIYYDGPCQVSDCLPYTTVLERKGASTAIGYLTPSDGLSYTMVLDTLVESSVIKSRSRL